MKFGRMIAALADRYPTEDKTPAFKFNFIEYGKNDHRMVVEPINGHRPAERNKHCTNCGIEIYNTSRTVCLFCASVLGVA